MAAAATVLAGVSLASPTGAAEGPVFQAPATIPTDCSVDVTKSLNRWIASVPDGSTLSFAPQGCYRIEKTILVKNRNGLTFEGNGATFRAFTDGTGYVADVQTRNHFYLWGGSDLVVRNLRVRGVNTDHRYRPEYAGQRGFRIAGVQRALLENLTVTEVRGDFVEVDPDYEQTWRWSSDITIQNSSFLHSGRQGLSVTGGRRVVFRGNDISGAARSVFDIEPDSGTGIDPKGFPTYGGAADIHILDNDVGPAGLLFFGNEVPYPDVVTKDIVISGNRLHGIPLNVLSVGHEGHHYKRFTITNNTSDRPYEGPRGAVELIYVDGAVISGNTVPFSAASPFFKGAVKIWGSNDVKVTYNKFSGADIPLQVDKSLFGTPWTGTPSGTRLACGNRFGEPGFLRLDAVCLT